MARQSEGGMQQRRRSAAEGRALVARYRSSQESIADFCRRNREKPHVLRYWLGRESEATMSDGFFVVTTPPEAETVPPKPEAPLLERADSALIIVLPAASSRALARTVRDLLTETRS